MARPVVSLKARALRFLSMREHSRLELARKLQRHVQEGEDIDALLDWLENAKFLSQARFSEALIHRRAARYGNNRIVSELQSHGVQGAALTDLKGRLQIDELARAREVWLKKFGTPPVDASERGKQMRFMQQRGFSSKSIQAAMCLRSDEEIFVEGE